MPSVVRSASPRHNGITKFTNCRLLRGEELVWDDVWVSSATGKVIRSQTAFYDEFIMPDEVVDLGGRILSPGFIECQLNGAYGFNFSTDNDMPQYGKQLRDLNKKLVQTGVTSYIPTVTSQSRSLYKKVLPYLGPSGASRRPHDGAESLGAHVEGPFLNPTKNGVHNPAILRVAETFSDLEEMYGAANLTPASDFDPAPSSPSSSSSSVRSRSSSDPLSSAPIKMITAAPELGAMASLIPALTARGILVSIGHSEATYEEASTAVAAGATMITHLFNAMRPLHHRNPGIFGVLGVAPAPNDQDKRPYFGLIADGIHLHPATVKIAWHAHPAGMILVTDAMHMVGLPDGRYPWTNGEGEHYIVKKGNVLELEGTGIIAGSSTTLIECVSNFLNYTGATIPQALRAVTATPAAMLGVDGVKGCLDAGADADLVVLSERGFPEKGSEREGGDGRRELVVDEVWKFGVRVF
ncbi:carbohydrate esterase family 9 protein [Chaetomium sp. MPI-SDFR-AT-0129]|nr:carbohydrate esterase family 9 protein [Chaetomium sp. MPI-SDFR-AT-0129]